MNNKTIAIMAIAAIGVMLIATSSLTTIDHAAFAKKHRHHHHNGNNNKQSQVRLRPMSAVMELCQ